MIWSSVAKAGAGATLATPWARKRSTKFARDYPGTNMAIESIKTALNSERKWSNVSDADEPVPNIATGPVTVCLNEIGQGFDDDNRIGRQLKVVNTQFRGNIEWNSAGDSVQTVRLLVFRYKRGDGGIPDVQDIMQGTTPWGFYQIDRSPDFQIMYSKVINVSDQRPVARFNMYNKKQFKCKYIGVGDTYTSTGDNAVWVAMFSDKATNAPTVTYQGRLRYVDN